jgi:hypothetical protein
VSNTLNAGDPCAGSGSSRRNKLAAGGVSDDHLSLTSADRLVESEFVSFFADTDEWQIERKPRLQHITR